MRKKIVAGNWKMNNTFEEGVKLTNEIIELSKNKTDKNVGIILCPPFFFLQKCVELIKNNSQISVGAQNCHSEIKGAFTGEVSATMLKSVGVKYVIIGHSERRSYFKEDNIFLSKKVKQVLATGLFPIYCCGETLPERESGKLFDIIKTQIEGGLFDLSKEDFLKTIIAYEPVWAIGTGVTATSEQAQEMHEFIRKLIIQKYGSDVAGETTILYGGSCNSKNAKELFANKDVDGGLIGGASLKSQDFIDIVNSF
ncbi:MAG: triose-phosphate isomerase [Bacteroidales bacterium]|nr:triose-phosphate isomerase [Bacteroidales bacterium]